MDAPRASWGNTTHDWSSSVDAAHLARIRQEPGTYAPGGPWHLALEVLAYAADEAASRGVGRCALVLRSDGSIAVRDDGRGTDTRVDGDGQHVRKPVMATKDLRFFDSPQTEALPDGAPRRGMSVVAALSEWLVHTNRRLDGAWTQRYEHGVPVSGLNPVEADGTSGTLVHFKPEESLGSLPPAGYGVLNGDLTHRLATAWPHLDIRLHDRRR